MIYQRGFNEFSPSAKPFRLIEIVQRKPLFDNLPFLKLRAGDQIVRGQFLRQPFGKGMKAGAPETWSEPEIFLQRAGHQMWIGSLEASGPVPLLSRNDLAYFDWALSRANADALFEIYRPKPSVSPAQLAMLDAELQPEFAEYLEESLTPFLEKDAKISPGFLYEMGEGDALKFVYAGLGYDGNTRAIFQFRLSLGAKGWSEERATLISAPTTPRFSPRPQQMVPGDRVDYLPRDPATRQRLEAHNARYCRFEAIIARVVEK